MASAMHSNLRQTDSKSTDINILLLGETGVGKSTFINSFVNYLQHTSLNAAKKSKLISLIPSRFTIPDENFVDRIIEFGYDDNEDIEIGNSSTQGARAYVFPFENNVIRLIDTPGIGDSRGINQDAINFENVLSYINQFEYLHAICFLLKPNVSVLNAYFKFCILHLLSRLEKSAAKNIIFIFTNSRSTFYRPGETLPVLKRILKEIEDSPPHVKIPCSIENMFCMDNEAFKFLVALQKKIKFGDHEIKEFSNSWERSYKTCRELISYICGGDGNQSLPPHAVQNTISVNEARRNIMNLSKPLADVCDLIQDNITVLNRHEDAIQQDNLSKSELTANLYVPVIGLEVKILPKPVTVCSASKCSEIYTVEGMNKYHYKQRCHNPCYLTNVPKEIIGSPELRNCAAMCGPTCTICGCDFSAHMHIYYQTEITNSRQEDKNVKRNIKTKEDAIDAKNKMVLKLKGVCSEYAYEKKEISKCMAKFAHFLKENSISAYNDAYIDYLDYLIARENMLGFQKDRERIDHYMSLKKHYEHEKRILDESMNNARRTNRNAVIVNPATVLSLVTDLYKLPHTGKKIKTLHTIQEKSVESSVKNTEYRHPTLMSSSNYESSSSDNEDQLQDLKIIETLMKEDNLEAMRLKLKYMNLNESDEDKIDDKKQKIWNIIPRNTKKNDDTEIDFDKNNKQSNRRKSTNMRNQNCFATKTQNSNRLEDGSLKQNTSRNVYQGQSNNHEQHTNRYGNNQRQHTNRYDRNNQGQQYNLYNNQAQPQIPTQPILHGQLQFVPNQFGVQIPNQNFVPPLMSINPNFPPQNLKPIFQESGPSNYSGGHPTTRGSYKNVQGTNSRGRSNNGTFKKRNPVNQKNYQKNTFNQSSSDTEEEVESILKGNKHFTAGAIEKFMEEYRLKRKSNDKSSVFMYYQKK